VGLCELVQRLAMFDYLAVSGSAGRRSIEYVDHVHEHFVDPARIEDGRCVAPSLPGFSAELDARTLERYRYLDGPVWSQS
jgi:L-fuconate dehydratase